VKPPKLILVMAKKGEAEHSRKGEAEHSRKGSAWLDMLSMLIVGIAIGLAVPWWRDMISPRQNDGPVRRMTESGDAVSHNSLHHNSSVVTISTEPPIQVIRGFLSAAELRGMQDLFLSKWGDGKFKDLSKRGETKTSFMWLPQNEDSKHAMIRLVDKRFAALAMVKESHLENGYFARNNKPIGGEFVSLHNDNSNDRMYPSDGSNNENSRFASLVVYLNTVEKNGLTVFPLAKPLSGPDPTTKLNQHMKHERGPPARAQGSQKAQPYWRFLDTNFDWRHNPRDTPEKEAAHQVVQRARDLCDSGSFAGGLQVRFSPMNFPLPSTLTAMLG
jgi:hypothetical protein